MTLEENTVYCFDCKLYLPMDQFAKRAKSINGYQPRFLGCASRLNGKWKSKKKHEDLKANGQLLLFEVS